MLSIDVSGDHLELAREFLDLFLESAPERRFVLGRGQYAEAIAEVMSIGGFVDDFADVVRWRDLPVLQTSDLPDDALVISAAMLRPISALRQLELAQVSAIDYFGVAEASKGKLPLVAGWNAFREDFKANEDRYLRVRSRLNDEKSVETFDRIVSFRLTGDLSFMQGFRYDPINQYFEDFLHLEVAGESFLDIGAYEGETSLEFLRRCPKFSHIYAIEPSPIIFRNLKHNLKHLPNGRVTLVNAALGDAQSISSFRDEGGTASSLDPRGSSVVEVQTLDSLGIEEVSLIKMDIEGSEIAALRGAEETIRKFHPRMALAAYHKVDDFWRIPEQIDRIGLDYSLAMRHYTEGIDETVLFFLPNAS